MTNFCWDVLEPPFGNLNASWWQIRCFSRLFSSVFQHGKTTRCTQLYLRGHTDLATWAWPVGCSCAMWRSAVFMNCQNCLQFPNFPMLTITIVSLKWWFKWIPVMLNFKNCCSYRSYWHGHIVPWVPEAGYMGTEAEYREARVRTPSKLLVVNRILRSVWQ